MKIDYVVENFETSEIERESRNEEKNCQNQPQSKNYLPTSSKKSF